MKKISRDLLNLPSSQIIAYQLTDIDVNCVSVLGILLFKFI